MRALLFDAGRNEILLIKALVPDTGVELWFTPGGGKEGDESDAECLAREVLEETGLASISGAQLVWTRTEEFVFLGEDYHQHERYFLVPQQRFEITAQTLEAHEQATFLEARWWRIEDIAVSDEQFVPGALAELLTDLVQALATGKLSDEPLHVGR